MARVADLHVCAAAVLRMDSRVLLCHRAATREWYPNVWDLPGGHVKIGESGADALRRELAEELGLVVDVSDEPWTTIVDQTVELEMSVWLIDQRTGKPSNLAPSEHDELRWCRMRDVESLELAHASYMGLLEEALTSR